MPRCSCVVGQGVPLNEQKSLFFSIFVPLSKFFLLECIMLDTLTVYNIIEVTRIMLELEVMERA